ncbi:MAG: 3'-5' exonuclease [Thiofilum sp.]|uniref:3'-5' exonuclease n=1 Tax=Thiofilum sp. TaxID=2212733 RepID=UPI0025FBDD9C|nr:3'-5' exonuclease [Thiofilum sp.]MBK8454622.1 3'-5' exonuclease [Thiofilum sp.]
MQQFLSALHRAWLSKRLKHQTQAQPLLTYLNTPSPNLQDTWQQGAYLVLDLETSGSDPLHDDILSFGWVIIRQEHIELASARHYLVQARRLLRERNVAIHHITDDQAAQGHPLTEVLTLFLTALSGKLLVAHYAPTELGFIKQACLNCFGAKPPIPTLDTLQLARRHPATRHHSLRLVALRSHYHLPRYALHNALSDALATAELLLAQLNTSPTLANLPLKDLITHT